MAIGTLYGYDEEVLCRVTGKWHEMNEKPDDCPLIEIPTPHGRLVDGDKVMEMLNEANIPCSGSGRVDVYVDVIVESEE